MSKNESEFCEAVREVIHLRYWRSLGNGTLTVKSICKAAMNKLYLQNRPTQAHWNICKIIEEIGGEIDRLTRRSWSESTGLNTNSMRYKERIYVVPEYAKPRNDGA